jgi:3-oxoacyl-[acyl-carrier protein] reductase
MLVSKKIDLHGKAAIVTGGARGIGAAAALALAREGASMTIGDILPADDVVEKIKALGAGAIGVRTDVSKIGDIDNLVTKAIENYGKIDILVTCAAVLTTGTIEDINEAVLDRTLNINLKGTIFTVQAAFREMKKQGSGKIVCIGSIAGKIGGILAGPHYVASKGGVHAFVKYVAKYGAEFGIYANAIAPGAIDTEMIRGMPYSPDYCPLKRLGVPGDIAEAVVFLASDASNYITGTVLDVNGGFIMN